MSGRRFILLATFSLTSLFVNAQSNDSLQIMKATETFLKAFTSFDWPTFRNAFAKAIRMTYPIIRHWELALLLSGFSQLDYFSLPWKVSFVWQWRPLLLFS